jgi:hypothetical protein
VWKRDLLYMERRNHTFKRVLDAKETYCRWKRDLLYVKETYCKCERDLTLSKRVRDKKRDFFQVLLMCC